jgi:ubiquinone/menaquinone biosynthesis C-methylase UbiE
MRRLPHCHRHAGTLHLLPKATGGRRRIPEADSPELERLGRPNFVIGVCPCDNVSLERAAAGCAASPTGPTNLTEVVRRGTTQLPAGGVNEAQMEGEIALSSGPVPRRVLDIAAGHGLFGLAVARRAPAARIVAVDWANVLEVTRENADAAGVQDRYEFIPGDVFTTDLGGGYDVVLLTNLLHHFREDECESLLRKIHSALEPGGRLLTLEFVPNEDRVTPPIPASFSLMMLGLTAAGDAYTMKQHKRMLANAGFQSSELLQVPQSPQQLIVSTK